MGQINVSIGGRSYPLACRDGEEERLSRLAAHVDVKATELTGALGQMSEPRLLLMAAILIADEHFETLEKSGEETGDAPGGNADAILGQVAERIEALASALEQRAAAP